MLHGLHVAPIFDDLLRYLISLEPKKDALNNSTMIYSTDGATFLRTPEQLFLTVLNEVGFGNFFLRFVLAC